MSNDRSAMFDALRGGLGGFLRRAPAPADAEPLDVLRCVADVVDLRGSPQAARAKRARRKGTLRKAEGGVLHQTASVINNWHNVPCHVGIARDGTVFLVHPLDAYLHAAHALNRRSVSIEIECRAAGVLGEPRSFWRKPGEKAATQTMENLAWEATDLQLDSMAHALHYLAGVLGPLKLWAHRQGDDSRVTDPGERIAVAAWETAATHPGLVMAPDDVFGTGTPWPQQWRRDGKGGPFAWWDK